jgi:hypothetical protein
MPSEPSGERRLLLLYWSPKGRRLRLGVERHLRALTQLPGRNYVVAYNAAYGAPAWLARFKPDGVLLHTTFLALRWLNGFERRRARSAWIAELRSAKLAFPQDDYDHAEILDEWLVELGVDVVLTAIPEHAGLIIPRTAARAEIRKVLTGYVDDADLALRPRPTPLAGRELHVVYRATRLPPWFGSHGRLKNDVGEAAVSASGSLGLRADVSTDAEDAVLGPRWLDFLASGRAVVGCESGSSVLDRRGEVRAAFGDPEPESRLPPDWDSYRFTALSPRHLEAALTGTAQVLVVGDYSGVLEAGRHYLPVRPDLADLEEALAQTREPAALQVLAHTAHEELCLSGRYSSRTFAAEVDDALRAHGGIARRRAPRLPLLRTAAAAQGALERRAGAAAARLRALPRQRR